VLLWMSKAWGEIGLLFLSGPEIRRDMGPLWSAAPTPAALLLCLLAALGTPGGSGRMGDGDSDRGGPPSRQSRTLERETFGVHGVLLRPSEFWGCPAGAAADGPLHNQGASGWVHADEMGTGSDGQCGASYSMGRATCGMARRRPDLLVADELPVLSDPLMRDACRAIKGMYHRLHRAQMVWDGRERPAYFPQWTRASESEHLSSALPPGIAPESLRRRAILEVVLPLVEGDCGEGYSLRGLGGEDCGLSFCDGLKYVCVRNTVPVPRGEAAGATRSRAAGGEGDAGSGAEGVDGGSGGASECLIYSFGSREEVSFELDAARTWPSCRIHVFDCYSIPAGTTRTVAAHPQITMHGMCLDSIDNATAGRYTLDGISAALGHQGSDIALLKMDMEGWEWFLFQQVSASHIPSICKYSAIASPRDNYQYQENLRRFQGVE